MLTTRRRHLRAGVVGLCWVTALCGAAFTGGATLTTSVAAAQPPARAVPVAPEGKERVNLAGYVRDEAGRAVPGATVYVYTAQPKVGVSAFCPSCYPDCGKRVTSDAAGGFLLENMDASLLFRVLVVSKGYRSRFAEKVDPKTGELAVTLQPASAAADPNRYRVRGRVIGEDGKPVVGALVAENAVRRKHSTGYGFNPTTEPLTITDAAGEFEFSCRKEMEETDHETGKQSMSPVLELQVKVTARDHAPMKQWLKADAPDVQDVRMKPGATVRGVVRDAYGRGVGGLRVIVAQTDRNSETYLGPLEIGTDPTGAFLLPNVPQVGKMSVTVAMGSLREAGKAVPVQTFVIEKEQAEVAGLNLNLTAGARVAGRVTLPDGARVPANTRLYLSREESWDSQELILPADGSFIFPGVPPGEKVSIFTRIPGYKPAPGTPGLQSWGSIHLDIPKSGGTVPLPLKMVAEDKR
jgi:hypothetical protein